MIKPLLSRLTLLACAVLVPGGVLAHPGHDHAHSDHHPAELPVSEAGSLDTISLVLLCLIAALAVVGVAKLRKQRD